MDSCFNHCETAKHEMPIDHFPSGGSVELICRDVDSLTLKIERDQKLPNKTVEQIAKFRRYTGYIYLLQIHEANKINATKHAYIVSSRLLCNHLNFSIKMFAKNTNSW